MSRSNAEIAYIVFTEYWKRGFAKEGVVWLLNYLFEAEKVLESSAAIDYRNRASIALIRSVGFKYKKVVSTNRGHDIVFVKQLGSQSLLE